MAARAWTTARTIELSLLTLEALLALYHAPTIPKSLLLCLTLLVAIFKAPTHICDTRIRRCDDGVGLACGSLLPLALHHSLPASGQFAALATSVTVITTAWQRRRRGLLAVFAYALTCATVSTSETRAIPHALIGSLVPFITDALVRTCPRTFTVAESAIIAGGMAGVISAGGDRLVHAKGDVDDVVNAALIGAVLVWWGVADCLHTPKARLLRRASVIVACISTTYGYAWRVLAAEPVRWVLEYIVADRRRWGVLVVWVSLLGWTVVGLKPEQRAERIVARKYYHVLALSIFAAGVACDEGLTRLGSAVGLAGLLLAEMGRVAGTPSVRRAVGEFAGRLVDERDEGAVVVTHLYLLAGCAAPLWIAGDGAFGRGGVVAVCWLDAVAAAVGRRWGRIKWPGSNRTVEGSTAGLLCAAAFARAWGGGWEVVVASAFGAVLEASTAQIDNLVLPMAYCAVVGTVVPR